MNWVRRLASGFPAVAATVSAVIGIGVAILAAEGPSFSSTIYAPTAPVLHGVAISMPAGATERCPSSTGLVAARPTKIDLASVLSEFSSPSITTARRAADRAAWPFILGSGGAATPFEASSIGRVAVAPPIYARMCGEFVASRSWTAEACGAARFARCDPGLTETYVFLDREGHWLIWSEYP